MKSQSNIEDRIALLRRGQLSANDQRALRGELQTSLEARLLLDAGRSFDAARAVESGDEMHVERLAEFAVRAFAVQGNAKPTKVSRSWDWAVRSMGARVIAGVVLFSAAATGAWSVVDLVVQRREAVATTGPMHKAVSTGAKALRARKTSESASTTLAEADPDSDLPKSAESKSARDVTAEPRSAVESLELARSFVARDVTQVPSSGFGSEGSARAKARGISVGETVGSGGAEPGPSASPSSRATLDGNAPGETAAQLFAAANLARRARDTDRATALYERLQQLFPGSPEARECSLFLGTLQLERAPAAALRQFRRYGAETSSAFAADALWGEARALRILGRTQEERDALSRLVVSFPSAPFAEAARRRLKELSP
ncbi:MAG: tetratricopeptide repeat protein [Polyangiaceae bacterium]